MKNNLKTLAYKISCTILGTLILALAINTIYIPNKLLSGGIAGLAAFLQITLDINSSLFVILFNIPIFIAGYILVNRKFTFYSFIGMISLSLCLFLTRNLSALTEDIIIAVILGGIISGVGGGIVLRVNSSMGGADILAKIGYKYFSISMGTFLFILNTFVIALSLFGFSLELALYTFSSMYITSKLTNYVVEGLSFKKSVFIVTSKPYELADAINEKLKRGSTILNAKGGYSKLDTHLIYTTISPRQVSKLKYIVKDIDSNSFMSVTETSYVLGKGQGFSNIKNLD